MAYKITVTGDSDLYGDLLYKHLLRELENRPGCVDEVIFETPFEDFDDTEEWAMTEREFREWYFTHSHKETTAFYNFFMEDEGSFRKIAPQVVEKELYTLWKNDPQLFTDMIQNFDKEDVEEYTFD